MKKTIKVIIIIICSTFASGNSFAAFPVSHTISVHQSIAATDYSKAGSNSTHKHKANQFFSKVTRLSHPFSKNHNYPQNDGSSGLLSLIFGCIGIFFPPLAIAAIICGAIGLSHDEKYSLAGLLLGIGAIVLWVLYFVLIFSIML